MRAITVIALAFLVADPLAAQTVPAGWKMRIDRSTSASDPDAAGAVKIVTAGAGYHIETPSAAVFWNSSNTVSGNYTLKATFTQNKRSGHVNHFGLVFGGTNLDKGDQRYAYFMVAQDNPPGSRMGAVQTNGVWLIKTRNGESTANPFLTVAGAMGRSGAVPSSVIKVPDSDGKSVNTLEVRVQAEKIDFVVNGTTVHSTVRTNLATDGIWGIRSNHLLDINVDDLSVTKQ